MENIPQIETPIKIMGLVEAYGKDKAALIVINQVRQTITMKQRQMRETEPVYRVLLKDPIAGKLIIKTDHVLPLEYIGKNNERRQTFERSEIDAMRKTMPGFDKYYEVRRA